MNDQKSRSISIKQFLTNYLPQMSFILKGLLIGFIALLFWFMEFRFFAIFIVIFVLVVVLLKPKEYFALIIAAILIFIIFNTLTLDSLLLLRKSDLPVIQHPKAGLTTLFTPEAGLDVLPPKVLSMISMLKQHNIDTYKLSDKFSQDVVIYQRLVEGAWPIRPESDSKYTLLAPEELSAYQNCSIVEKIEDSILVNCY
jgi:hypothetical protein